MRRPVTVNIPHQLGKAEARRRIADGCANVKQQLAGGMMGALSSVEERWEGDRLHFSGGGLGQKIDGRLDVLEDAVQIQVDLPEILALAADRVMGKLKQGTQALLEKKP